MIPLQLLYTSSTLLNPPNNPQPHTTMAPADSVKSAQASKDALDVISNRVAIALAKHDKLVKSWTGSSDRPRLDERTKEELEAEDAALFRKTPQYLGVGASIPSHFLVSDAERNNKSLRAKFFPTKGFKGSKPRDEEEKAASAKRGKVEDSSDDEGGRSSLGKAKKRKKNTDLPSKQTTEVEKQPMLPMVKVKEVPAIESKAKSKTIAEVVLPKEVAKKPDEHDNRPTVLKQELPKSAEQRKKDKKKLQKLLKKQEKKDKNKELAEAV